MKKNIELDPTKLNIGSGKKHGGFVAHVEINGEHRFILERNMVALFVLIRKLVLQILKLKMQATH